MNDKAKMVGAAIAGLFVIAFVLGLVTMGSCRGCDGCNRPAPVLPIAIDAGPGEAEIEARLDAALQTEEAEIRRLEEAHAVDLSLFDEAQRAEYERARAGGRAEVARWLSGFNRSMKDAGR